MVLWLIAIWLTMVHRSWAVQLLTYFHFCSGLVVFLCFCFLCFSRSPQWNQMNCDSLLLLVKNPTIKSILLQRGVPLDSLGDLWTFKFEMKTVSEKWLINFCEKPHGWLQTRFFLVKVPINQLREFSITTGDCKYPRPPFSDLTLASRCSLRMGSMSPTMQKRFIISREPLVVTWVKRTVWCGWNHFSSLGHHPKVGVPAPLLVNAT